MRCQTHHYLVERFARNADAYRRTEYKEAEVRHEFSEPFFAALGWDAHNLAGHAEAYKIDTRLSTAMGTAKSLGKDGFPIITA